MSSPSSSLISALTGTFGVDLSKSDSMEPIMIAMGVSWMARKAALAITPPDQIFECTATGFSVKSNPSNAYVFGEMGVHHMASGDSIPCVCKVSDDGSHLILDVDMSAKGYTMSTTYQPVPSGAAGGVLATISMIKTGSAAAESVIKRVLNRK